MGRPWSPPPPPPPRPGTSVAPPRIRGASFSDRVMAQVANEPRPTPLRVFTRSLLTLRPGAAAAALASAIRIAFTPTAGASGKLRAGSLGLVLSVVAIIGLGGPFAAAGLMARFSGDSASQAPAIGAPSLVPATIAPLPSPSLAPSPSPSPTPKATPKPKPKPKAKAKAKAKASDDKKANTERSTTKTRTPKPVSDKGTTTRRTDDKKDRHVKRESTEKPEDD